MIRWSGGSTARAGWLVPAAAAVVVRPALWGTALRQLRALAAPGWVRRRPHLPLPPAPYLRFRLVTAYGDPDAAPAPADVVAYLSWCRDEHRRSAPSGAAPTVSGARNRPLQARAGR